MRFRFIVFFVVFSALFFSACDPAPLPPEPTPETRAAYYVASGERYDVTVFYDRVAFGFHPQASDEDRTSVIEQHNFQQVESLWTKHRVALFDAPLTPEEIWRLVQDLQSSESILHAGLVVEHNEGQIFMLTDEVRVQFAEGVIEDEIGRLNADLGVDVLRDSSFHKNRFTLRIDDPARADALAVAEKYHRTNRVTFAYPNFIFPVQERRYAPNDPFLDPDAEDRQWHLRDTSTTMDGVQIRADIRAIEAWSYLEERDLSLGVDLLWSHRAATADSDTGSQKKDSPRTGRCGVWRFERQNLVREGIIDGLDLTPEDIVIAIIEHEGIEWHHRDLCNNLYFNPFEEAHNGEDDDKDKYDDDLDAIYIDDVRGWDFADNDPNAEPEGSEEIHGTAVAGLAAAHGNNGEGVVGTCPECLFMPIRAGAVDVMEPDQLNEALRYAALHADVINLSMGACVMHFDDIEEALTAAGRETVMVHAGEYFGRRCPPGRANFDQSPHVLTVFHSNKEDVGIASPLSLPESGHIYAPGEGLLTTDRTGAAGYNDGTGELDAAYTSFGGSSGAAPVTSGVAALTLVADHDLTPAQVRRILKDTADKIQHNYDREADTSDYDPQTGFQELPPDPVSDRAGYGRINAFNAVKVAHQGVDLFLRDNILDWGNTGTAQELEPVPSGDPFAASEFDDRSNRLPYDADTDERTFIPHWHSVDIKVDSKANGGWQEDPPSTSVEFDELEHEKADPNGGMNRVYVRVHNRGPETAESVNVKLLWAHAGSSLPKLPADVLAGFPNDPEDFGEWSPLRCSSEVSSLSSDYDHTCTIREVPYSGASVAGCPDRGEPSCDGDTDESQVAVFEFPGPDFDLFTSNHYCLLALIESEESAADSIEVDSGSRDSFNVDRLTPKHNNITHRNIKVADSSTTTEAEERFLIRTATEEPAQIRLRLSAPQGWQVELDGVDLNEPFLVAPGQPLLATMRVTLPQLGETGQVVVIQETQVDNDWIVSGMTYQFRPLQE